MKTGIVFDMDGTLWDACDEIAKSWNVVFEKYPQVNVRMDYDTTKAMMGKHMRDIIASLVPNADGKLLEKLVVECCDYEIQYINEGHPGKMFAGAVDTIKKLKEKYFIGIVSNCQEGYIESMIKSYGLNDIVDDYLCAGVSGVPKADNIKNIREQNNLEKVFYIGDTMGDCIAAKEAGAKFIFAAYGFGNVEDELSIEDIRELPELIEKQLSGQ